MSITISGGGGVPGITVETDPTALKLTGGTITANSSSVAALRIVQQGAGNVLEVFDQNGDPTPLTVDGNGDIGIGTNPITGLKLHVGGAIRVTDVIQAYSGISVLGSLSVNGIDYKEAATQYMFSGNIVSSSSTPINTSVYWSDGSTTYTSGTYDSNNNEIPFPEVGNTQNDIGWNGVDFATINTSTNYHQQGTQLTTFYVNSTGTVTVYSNGWGGLDYSPPSQ
jgi:hypothetical protein